MQQGELTDLRLGGYTFMFAGTHSPAASRWARRVRDNVWETEVIREVINELRPGDAFFDVGAYLGPYTLLASRLVGATGVVHAFEPDPIIRRLLKRNIEANNARNVVVSQLAIAASSGFRQFACTSDSRSHLDVSGELQVKSISLDDYCRTRKIWPDVTKFDIEGGEYEVLAQRPRSLLQTRALVVELHGNLHERKLSLDTLLSDVAPFRVIARKSCVNFHVLCKPRLREAQQ